MSSVLPLPSRCRAAQAHKAHHTGVSTRVPAFSGCWVFSPTSLTSPWMIQLGNTPSSFTVGLSAAPWCAWRSPSPPPKALRAADTFKSEESFASCSLQYQQCLMRAEVFCKGLTELPRTWNAWQLVLVTFHVGFTKNSSQVFVVCFIAVFPFFLCFPFSAAPPSPFFIFLLQVTTGYCVLFSAMLLKS